MVKEKIDRIKSKATHAIQRIVEKGNVSFNSMSGKGKRIALLVFGVAMGGISFMLIIQALSHKENGERISIDKIKVPKDIYMNDERATILEDQLIPVGKFKGEIDGEFEAFYLAVDSKGKTYINRSIDFSRGAYHKSKGWEEITKAALERYQKQLHFLPARTKAMKH